MNVQFFNGIVDYRSGARQRVNISIRALFEEGWVWMKDCNKTGMTECPQYELPTRVKKLETPAGI